MSDEPVLTPEIAAALFGKKNLSQAQPEPAVESTPPKGKPVSEWSESEAAAARESFDRTMAEKAKADERQQREQEAQTRAQQSRTPEQRHNDTLAEMVSHGSKRQADEALIRSLHGGIAGDDVPRPTASPDFDPGIRGDLPPSPPPLPWPTGSGWTPTGEDD
jgi:hypothetical protein